MRRLRILYSFATIAALVALAAVLSACGGGGGSNGDAEEVIDNATLQGIESGKVDLAVKLSAKGENGGNLDLNVSGAFRGEGQGELPVLDGSANAKGKVSGEKVDFEAGLVLLPTSGYVNYEGTEYEIDPNTYTFIESAVKQAQREGGGEDENGNTTACQEEFGELKFREFIENAENEGSVDVGDESTTKVSGELNVPALLDQATEIAESPACSAQLSVAGELPSGDELDESKEEVEKAVKQAKVDLYVGEDGIVRRFVIQLRVEPQNGGDGPSSVDVNLDLRLTEVNEGQKFSAPGGKKQPLSDLFVRLDVNPIELVEQLQGEGEAGQLDFEGLLEKLGKATR